MPEFAYVAVGPDGQRVQGTAVAPSEDALASQLKSRDQFLVEARAAGASSAVEGDTIDLSQIRMFESITRRDVIFFTTQLATVMATGINVVEGLRGIESQIVKAPMKAVVSGLIRSIENGESLSRAMERHPDAFDELYVNIVRSGEATGRMDKTLDDLAAQLEWQDRLSQRVREALTYPMLIVGLLTVLMTVLVGFTIPRFALVYQRVNAELQLPWPTRVVQGTAAFLSANWFIVVLAIIVLYLLYKLRVQEPDGSVWLSKVLLRIPVFGEAYRKVALSRFARYFGTMHEAGLEVAPALSLMERVIGNAYLSQRFRGAVARVMAGESLSRALAAAGEFSPIVIQMVALGETTGQMSRALEQVRIYYDREVDLTVNRALTLFGPIALVVLASVFMLIAVAFYLPLFNLARAVR